MRWTVTCLTISMNRQIDRKILFSPFLPNCVIYAWSVPTKERSFICHVCVLIICMTFFILFSSSFHNNRIFYRRKQFSIHLIFPYILIFRCFLVNFSNVANHIFCANIRAIANQLARHLIYQPSSVVTPSIFVSIRLLSKNVISVCYFTNFDYDVRLLCFWSDVYLHLFERRSSMCARRLY